MPISWFYNEWAPARDFRDTPLDRVVADFEATGLLREGAGPAHIRAPIGSESNVRWYRPPRRP